MQIYPNSVAASLYTTLASDSTLVSSGVLVQLHEPYNSDPANTPWVGVYLEGPEVVPFRVMQGGTPWQATYDMNIFLQATSLLSAEDAMDRLMRLVTPVVAAIDSNRTLDNTVRDITGLSIETFDVDQANEGWYVTYRISLQAEADA